MSRKYPIGIQSFEKLRSAGYVYVDKTRYVWQLVQEGEYYFMSRPRRFGKSLLISTLEAFFRGRRDLFAGLYIDGVDYDWAEYPVLHIDLNSQNYNSDDGSLDRMLDSALAEWEQAFGLTPKYPDASLRFASVIKTIYQVTGRRVVVLIDEYDKPLLDNIFNARRTEEFRNTLKAFYGVLKSCDPYIRFAFLTGVTRFGKVSVFSDLNNLRDITLQPTYNALCGVSESELAEVFGEDIRKLADSIGDDYGDTLVRLKRCYDGYRFTRKATEGIYNPYSLLNVLQNRMFDDYWFNTGTPAMLVELIKRTNMPLYDFDNIERTSGDLTGLEPAFRDPVPILFQSGYLTVKGFDERRARYRLGFPNEEVERGLLESLLPVYLGKDVPKNEANVFSLLDALESGNIDQYMLILQSFMADIPYSSESARIPERRFSDIMYITSRLIGINAEAEYSTNRGRIDLLIKTRRYIYIMEFKVDASPASALEQIDTMQYARPFISDDRTIIKVGAEFSTVERNISSWETEICTAH